MKYRPLFVAPLAALVFALVFSTCALKVENLRLEGYDEIKSLEGPAAELEVEQIRARVDGLWTDLKDQKLAAYSTKDKIADYFENEKDLTEFIAIQTALMRRNSFAREIVLKYRVNQIKLEPNNVVAQVDMEVWGTIYFIWRAKIHEIQRWEKSGGRWYLRPQAF
ncbi:MAG: hypothetical protein H6684_04025 [Deltaproteobacteria bacterium]|nr:hypothetical protein [bacterium]MCB9487881.1 hypothetical protein [Deltaproteobacteria bacterium]